MLLFSGNLAQVLNTTRAYAPLSDCKHNMHLVYFVHVHADERAITTITAIMMMRYLLLYFTMCVSHMYAQAPESDSI